MRRGAPAPGGGAPPGPRRRTGPMPRGRSELAGLGPGRGRELAVGISPAEQAVERDARAVDIRWHGRLPAREHLGRKIIDPAARIPGAAPPFAPPPHPPRASAGAPAGARDSRLPDGRAPSITPCAGPA